MKLITENSKFRFIVLTVCVLFVSGCSGSNANVSDALEQSNIENVDGLDTPDEATSENELAPSSLASTRVTFDITVPPYMSNELQVRLESRGINTTAAFIRDESWSVSETFPNNTDHPVVVTFADSNGAITLGTVDTVFRTSSNTSQTVRIMADQFDTDRWDTDGDGVSNLDELIAGTSPEENDPLQPVQASLEIRPIKTFRINWQSSANASFYRVLENPDGISGFSPISEDLTATSRFFDHQVALFNRVDASYVVQACNTNGCADSDPMLVTGSLESAIGYIKASNPENDDSFGSSVALSADGTTLAVSAPGEDSAATGINGDQADNSARSPGAVYVFFRSNSMNNMGGVWQQQAYLKASNTDEQDSFGGTVSLSADGNTLAVGAVGEDSTAIGINGDQTDNSISDSGAVYVFVRSDGAWQQQAYVKASNTNSVDLFGTSLSLSADGNNLAVGAIWEDSAATGINGDQSNNAASDSGAVYVYFRSDGLWQQQAYLKASNTNRADQFGGYVSLSADGSTLAVSATEEDSAATGINGNENDNSAFEPGAVYVFARSDGLWQQQAYIKASNAANFDNFGNSLSLSADGNTLAVSADEEDIAAIGINGNEADNSARQSGAVYIFVRSIDLWQQQAYIKASNAESFDLFGSSVSLSSDGDTLAVGARGEGSAAPGINGDQTSNSATAAGALYLFVRSSGDWQQRAYIKTANTGDSDFLGGSVSLSANGNTLAAGARFEASAASGINGDTTDNSEFSSGAVYLY